MIEARLPANDKDIRDSHFWMLAALRCSWIDYGHPNLSYQIMYWAKIRLNTSYSKTNNLRTFASFVVKPRIPTQTIMATIGKTHPLEGIKRDPTWECKSWWGSWKSIEHWSHCWKEASEEGWLKYQYPFGALYLMSLLGESQTRRGSPCGLTVSSRQVKYW
jgi:hypothetical protein